MSSEFDLELHVVELCKKFCSFIKKQARYNAYNIITM